MLPYFSVIFQTIVSGFSLVSFYSLPSFSAVFQAIVSGVLLGSLYALISTGLNLIFGVMKVLNFAHCEFMMMSMYATYWLFALLGLDPLVSLVPIMLLFFLIGYLTQRFIIKPMILKSTSSVQQFNTIFLVTLGLSIIMQNLAQMLWQAKYFSVMPSYASWVITFGDIRFYGTRLVAGTAAISITLFLYLIYKKTNIGKAMRATSQNRQTAELMGINVFSMYNISFGIAMACGAAAGVLLSTFYYTYPTVGSSFLSIAFLIVVIGGLGSFLGGFLGGIVVGMVGAVSAVFLSAAWQPVAIFVFFIIVVLIKREGSTSV